MNKENKSNDEVNKDNSQKSKKQFNLDLTKIPEYVVSCKNSEILEEIIDSFKNYNSDFKEIKKFDFESMYYSIQNNQPYFVRYFNDNHAYIKNFDEESFIDLSKIVDEYNQNNDENVEFSKSNNFFPKDKIL